MDYDDNGPEYASDDVAATWKPIPPVESHCKDTDREFFRPLGNKRKYRLRKWMSRVLNDGHLRRTNDWMSERMKQHAIARVDPDAGARAEAEREAKAEALWDYFKRCGEATAHGRPQPPMPASLME